jgi:integrase
MAKLTTKFIENIKPANARREIPDAGCRGLYLVVQPTGRKAWAVRFRFGGKTRKLTLDAGLTLAAARQAASAALHELERGNDPAALKFDAEAAAKKAAADRAGDTVDNLAAQFIERYAKKKTRKNSWRQAVHVFENIVLPAWRGRVIHDIARRDIRELVENVAEDRPIMANRALGHISKFFNWLCEQDIIAASPSAGVKPPAPENPRDRVLSDAEIKALWHACEGIGGAAGPAIKLMLLTAQRCGEVVGMKRSEISGYVWTLPPERTKNKVRHEVPLSAQALAIIEELPAIDEDFVFTSSETRRLGNMSHAKAALDASMKPKQPWVLHDLRRTAASGMAALGIKLPVIEKCLNHMSGSFKGIVGVYQRHDFAAEKRHALQTWADHVERLVSGTPETKVVPLSAKKTSAKAEMFSGKEAAPRDL